MLKLALLVAVLWSDVLLAAPRAYLFIRSTTKICLLGTNHGRGDGLVALGPETRACLEQAEQIFLERTRTDMMDEYDQKRIDGLDNQSWIPPELWSQFEQYSGAGGSTFARDLDLAGLVGLAGQVYEDYFREQMIMRALDGGVPSWLTEETEAEGVSGDEILDQQIYEFAIQGRIRHFGLEEITGHGVFEKFDDLVSRQDVIELFRKLFVDRAELNRRIDEYLAQVPEQGRIYRRFSKLYVDGADFSELHPLQERMREASIVDLPKLLARGDEVWRKLSLRHSNWVDELNFMAEGKMSFVAVGLGHVIDDSFGADETLPSLLLKAGYQMQRLDCASLLE